MKINLNKSAWENCPSFERCNTNRCPLHKDFFKLKNMLEDRILMGWKKCRCSKSKRMENAASFNLKWLGLTDRERDSMRKSIEMKKQFSGIGKNKLETPNLDIKQEDSGPISDIVDKEVKE